MFSREILKRSKEIGESDLDDGLIYVEFNKILLI